MDQLVLPPSPPPPASPTSQRSPEKEPQSPTKAAAQPTPPSAALKKLSVSAVEWTPQAKASPEPAQAAAASSHGGSAASSPADKAPAADADLSPKGADATAEAAQSDEPCSAPSPTAAPLPTPEKEAAGEGSLSAAATAWVPAPVSDEPPTVNTQPNDALRTYLSSKCEFVCAVAGSADSADYAASISKEQVLKQHTSGDLPADARVWRAHSWAPLGELLPAGAAAEAGPGNEEAAKPDEVAQCMVWQYKDKQGGLCGPYKWESIVTWRQKQAFGDGTLVRAIEEGPGKSLLNVFPDLQQRDESEDA